MFFGQINAPATLPIYVLMHLLNSKFLGRLYCTLPLVAFLFMLHNKAFLLNEERDRNLEENSIVKPHSHRKAYCYMIYICVTACFVLEFSWCVSHFPPLRRR